MVVHSLTTHAMLIPEASVRFCRSGQHMPTKICFNVNFKTQKWKQYNQEEINQIEINILITSITLLL